MNSMVNLQTLEIPISGMDCAECTMHVQHAIERSSFCSQKQTPESHTLWFR
ncbi:MAG: hypothetical protein HND47_16050 [Chloroflexi bacterium]|nr:hypothetical protein [Chloroflexota bacterium]